MFDEFNDRFAKRLIELRGLKGSSARNMSLSIGRDGSYIGKIERKIFLPTVAEFYYICEFLGILPEEFFNYELDNPAIIKEISNDLAKLDNTQLANVKGIVQSLANSSKKTDD